MDDATKARLTETIYYPLRRSPLCRGRGDPDVMALARAIAEHLELCRWNVTPPARDQGHRSPPADPSQRG